MVEEEVVDSLLRGEGLEARALPFLELDQDGVRRLGIPDGTLGLRRGLAT
jgi:hypothetical protein